MMTFAVIATGNHYLLDAAAGGLVILCSLGLSALSSRRATAVPPRTPPVRRHRKRKGDLPRRQTLSA
jgi:hypothetical protein